MGNGGGKPSRKNVAVIGAGIVGVACAVWLQRAGHRVTVFDPRGPAGAASHGNAGVLAAASIVPVTVPGLWRKAPRLLLDPREPLYLRLGYLPRLLPFLRRYMAHARPAAVERIADALSLLLHDTVDQHRALSEGTGAERYVDEGDYVFGYRDRTAFEADAFAWNHRAARGHAFEPLEADALAAYDPALTGRFGYGVRCPHHGRISDPGAYVRALARHVERKGGRFVTADILDVTTENERATGVATMDGVFETDAVVLAAGVWSARLAKRLGVTVPMEAERGYHVEFVDPSITPRSPTMVAAGKFVLTPMDGRLRAAGIVEFGGLGDDRSKAPFRLLSKQTKAVLPGLRYSHTREWMGHRPSTADSLPVIGRTGPANVFSAFGHQHVGLTGAPKTGRWIAELVSGRAPNADLAPFDPLRFDIRKPPGRTS